MARAKGLLENMEGHIGGFTVYKRGEDTFVRPTHIHQPRRLSRGQLLLRERQSHNNALWRALKRSGRVYFEYDKAPYYHFMSVNTFSPVPYLRKQHYYSNNALLLPEMVVSDGSLPSIDYQLGEVDGQAALLTDLTRAKAGRMTLLLYVLRQRLVSWLDNEEQFRLDIDVESLTADAFVEVHGRLALVGDRYADPMLGFALVQVQDGVASHQRVVTRCTYYERFTTEEALQAAAKSYGGLTGE